jgi:threonyl-tRNA synthetase
MGEGDGAFYGPKIDIILKDANGNEHQTATVQLDFQLPQRFKLKYEVPSETNPVQMVEEVPVLIHRAVAGSLERFLAVLIEHYNGTYPFWFSPSPVRILSVSQSPEELEYVDSLAAQVGGIPSCASEKAVRVSIGQNPITVETDIAARSLGKKIALAKKRGFNFHVVVGPNDVAQGTCSLTFGNQRNPALAMKELADILNTDYVKLKEKKSITMDGPALKKFFTQLQDKYL